MVSMEKPRFCQSQLIQGNTWRTDAVSHLPTQNNSIRPRLTSKCRRSIQETYTRAARVSFQEAYRQAARVSRRRTHKQHG